MVESIFVHISPVPTYCGVLEQINLLENKACGYDIINVFWVQGHMKSRPIWNSSMKFNHNKTSNGRIYWRT